MASRKNRKRYALKQERRRRTKAAKQSRRESPPVQRLERFTTLMEEFKTLHAREVEFRVEDDA